jgi:ferric-dicitrate binding protein FerR (iron transport regulator)
MCTSQADACLSRRRTILPGRFFSLAISDASMRASRDVVTHNVSMNDYLAWRDGRIVATSRPAAEVLDELGRWYDARFSIPDSTLASRSVSVDLRVGSGVSLESVLDALMLTLDASYARNGATITVSPR